MNSKATMLYRDSAERHMLMDLIRIGALKPGEFRSKLLTEKGGGKMGLKTTLVLGILIAITAMSGGCASTQKQDIESKLISAFAVNCKTVELKVDGDRDIYMITPTGRVDAHGCPIALIMGWREGTIIKEKEVEVCECGEKKGR